MGKGRSIVKYMDTRLMTCFCKEVPFGGSDVTAPRLGVKSPKKTSIYGVHRYFQAKRIKHQNVRVIKTTASLPQILVDDGPNVHVTNPRAPRGPGAPLPPFLSPFFSLSHLLLFYFSCFCFSHLLYLFFFFCPSLPFILPE